FLPLMPVFYRRRPERHTQRGHSQTVCAVVRGLAEQGISSQTFVLLLLPIALNPAFKHHRPPFARATNLRPASRFLHRLQQYRCHSTLGENLFPHPSQNLFTTAVLAILISECINRLQTRC